MDYIVEEAALVRDCYSKKLSRYLFRGQYLQRIAILAVKLYKC